MIRNKLTDETILVANWFLYSGFVDLDELYVVALKESFRIADNCRKTEPEMSDDDYNSFWVEVLSNKMAQVVENELTIAFYEGSPESWREDAKRLVNGDDTEDHYRDKSPSWLVKMLFADALARISSDDVAKLIAEYVITIMQE